jgi:hypothetical protein
LPFVRPAIAVLDMLELHKPARLKTGVAALVALLLLAGCGSSKQSTSTSTSSTTATPASWADSMCSAFNGWKTTLTSTASSLKNGGTPTKAQLEQAATTVSDATTRLSSDLEALGPPPKTGSAEAKTALQQLSAQLQSSANQIKAATKNVSGANGVLQAASVVSTAFASMSTDILSTVAKLQSLNATDEWRQAFADSQSCRSLKKS